MDEENLIYCEHLADLQRLKSSWVNEQRMLTNKAGPLLLRNLIVLVGWDDWRRKKSPGHFGGWPVLGGKESLHKVLWGLGCSRIFYLRSYTWADLVVKGKGVGRLQSGEIQVVTCGIRRSCSSGVRDLFLGPKIPVSVPGWQNQSSRAQGHHEWNSMCLAGQHEGFNQPSI